MESVHLFLYSIIDPNQNKSFFPRVKVFILNDFEILHKLKALYSKWL